MSGRARPDSTSIEAVRITHPRRDLLPESKAAVDVFGPGTSSQQVRSCSQKRLPQAGVQVR